MSSIVDLKALFEPMRTIDYGSTSGSYVTVGLPFAYPIRILIIDNVTNGDMIFSFDGSTDHFYVPLHAYKLIDVTSNRDQSNVGWFLEKGSQLYIKQTGTAPSEGNVYISTIY